MSKLQNMEVVVVEEGSRHLLINFTTNDAVASIVVDLPVDWDGWNRGQKMSYGRQSLVDHLAKCSYSRSGEVLYLDLEVPDS